MGEGAKKMPEGVGLRVVFQEISFPESPTEESTRIATDIKSGLTSAAHEIARKKNIPLDDAIKEAKEIQKIQKEIRGNEGITMPFAPPGTPLPGQEGAGEGGEGEGA